jgi:hypothetical protein
LETPITAHELPNPLESYGATPSTSIIIILNLYFFSDLIKKFTKRNPLAIAIN